MLLSRIFRVLAVLSALAPGSLSAIEATPFLESHCIQCHGPKKQKGKVTLHDLPTDFSNPRTANRWVDVLDQLTAEDMPPEDEDQPSAKEREALITGLTNVVTARPDTLGMQYSELGITNSVHALGHLQDEKATNGMTGHQARAAVEKPHLDGISGLARKLDSMPEGDGTIGNLYLAFMQAAGMKTPESFGEPDSNLKDLDLTGPLSELLV